MKVFCEIICLPFTFLIWLISLLFIFIFSFDMFRKINKGDKSFMDIFMDINYIIYRTYIIDWYFNTSLYLRTIISLTIYYLLLK